MKMVVKWTESVKERKLEAERRNLKGLRLLPYLPVLVPFLFTSSCGRRTYSQHKSNGRGYETVDGNFSY
jgi:hypothetical protein